jgi:hypothetical protein
MNASINTTGLYTNHSRELTDSDSWSVEYKRQGVVWSVS